MSLKQQRIFRLRMFARQLEEKFEDAKYWEHEQFLSNGSYGITVLLREVNHLVARQKRMVLKVSLGGAQGVQQLKNEIKWLKKLRGAKHIVRLLASSDNLRHMENETEEESILEQRVQAFGKLNRIPPGKAFGPLAGMDGLALALEYLDQSDLITLKMNAVKYNAVFPNKVLWALFMCLIRACIGIAYPLERQEGTPSVLETIPSNDTKPSAIVHGDVASRNIMITSGDGLEEHHVGNMFKMIDFGSTVEYGPPRGPPENLYDSARVVLEMLGSTYLSIGTWKGSPTRGGMILPSADDPNDDPFPGVDLPLRDLLARCLYVDSSKRPSLQEALDEAQAALAKPLDEFPQPEFETGEIIREFWQNYLYNVPDFR